MKVALIGATGRTGLPLLETLLDRGHVVSVLVRDPAKLGVPADRVRVVVGNARDELALAQLVEGADAVVSALGPSDKDKTLHSDVAAGLVGVMTTAGVRRFVGVSAAGIDVPGDIKSGRDRFVSKLIRIVGGAAAKDKPAEYAVWAASDLDWTLVRPPRLAKGAATGNVEHHASTSCKKTSITRADLAAFLVDVVEDSLYVQQAPFVAGA